MSVICFRGSVHDPSRLAKLTPAQSAARADWVVASVRDFDHTVGSVVGASFEAYARVFHPARRGRWPNSVEVRWADVAGANGRVMHRAAEWGSITGSWQFQYGANQPGVWDEPPATGNLPDTVASRLASVLAGHTNTPDRCWFAVWAGRGALSSELRGAAEFELPGREMLLLHGPIDAAATSPFPGSTDSVNLWWPEDKAWCVGTDIDLMTTYVGGSARCIEHLLAERSIETLPVSLDQRITWDADTINPLPPPP
jgi:hypothetical protein